VSFPRLDGTLGCITWVDVWWYSLKGNVIFCECLFHVVGAFVVNDVQLRCVSALLQLFVCFVPCLTYCTALPIWDSCC